MHYPLCYGEARAQYTGARLRICLGHCLRNAQSTALRVDERFAPSAGVLIHIVCG